MAKVVWLHSATEDAIRLFYFLETKDQPAAKRMLQAVETGAERILKSPRIGFLRGDDRREFYIQFGDGYYVLRYILDAEQNVIIIRVWHSREDRNPV